MTESPIEKLNRELHEKAAQEIQANIDAANATNRWECPKGCYRNVMANVDEFTKRCSPHGLSFTYKGPVRQ